MIKIYVYFSLLSALSIVEMKPLNINGRVGESVEFQCSDWDSWTNVNYNVKYFCRSPCTRDEDIIIRAAFEKSTSKNRIQLVNIDGGLFVTFTNLQKSDSGTYYCGAERTGHDSYIEVKLTITDAEFSSPKTTPETIIIRSTASFAVTNSSTVSSGGSGSITDTSVSYTIHSTTSATQGAGSVPYLITGVIVIPTILMVLLMLMRKMRKKRKKRVEEDARESPAGPDGVYQSLHPLTMDEEQVYSTLQTTIRKVSSQSAVPDGVYQSLHPLTKDEDQVYDTLKPT